MEKLPFLISIPHGGTEMPPELKNSVCITPNALFDDTDAFTFSIFDSENIVVHQVFTNIARAFVDMSRSPEKMPPDFPDGLIKSATCYAQPIYKDGKQPDKQMTETLIKKYYRPYHDEIERHIEDKNIILGLDCHSMAEIAPIVAPDSGNTRPLINLGDAEGSACNPEITRLLRISFLKVFGFQESDVTINNPFKGGYITRKYGNTPKPWIQIELNRKLYLDDKYFDNNKLQMKSNRLQELNAKFRKVLSDFNASLK